MKVGYYILLIGILMDCSTEPKKIKIFECQYKELSNTAQVIKSKDGHQITGNIGLILQANTKSLLGGRVEADISDSLNFNYIEKIITEETKYSASRIQTHNSIIQILCAIEKDLLDSSLTIKQKDLLFKEKIEKRTEYFDFLLRVQQESIPKKDKVSSRKKDERKMKKSEQEGKIIQQREQTRETSFLKEYYVTINKNMTNSKLYLIHNNETLFLENLKMVTSRVKIPIYSQPMEIQLKKNELTWSKRFDASNLSIFFSSKDLDK